MNSTLKNAARGVFCLLVSGSLYGQSWYNNSWVYRKPITIARAQVSGSSSLTNFPVLISIANDSNLQSSAQSNGNDILFTDSTGTNKLNHEIESYSNGTLVAWVRVPTVSTTNDTVIYMYYDNPSAGGQQNPAGVWDSNYLGVWHQGNGTSTPDYSDSTSNGSTLTPNGTPTTTTGFGGATNAAVNYQASWQYSGSSAESGILGNAANSRTLSFWFNFDSFLSSDNNPQQFIGNSYNDDGNLSSFGLQYSLPGQTVSAFWNNGTNGGYYTTNSTSALSAGTWYFATVQYNASTSTMLFYLNGSLVGSTSVIADPIAGTHDNLLVAYLESRYSNIEAAEIRESNVARSAAWIATEYNSESAPTSFFSVGSPQVSSSLVTITLTSSPVGLSLTADGSSCTSPCSFQWLAGSNHTIAATSPLAGAAGTQYLYASWSDNGNQSHSITVPSSATTYTASFTTQYYLTTSLNPASEGSIIPASGWYNSGAMVSVSTTADNGDTFTGFSGGLSGTASPQTITMSAPVTVTANFSGAGTPPTNVSVSPSSSSVGVSQSQTYTFTYADSAGASNIAWVEVDIGPTIATAQSCFFVVNMTQGNSVTLETDEQGLGSSLSNSQCSILGSASVQVSGTALTVSLPISFTASYQGTQNIFMQAGDVSGQESQWQALGTVTVSSSSGTGWYTGWTYRQPITIFHAQVSGSSNLSNFPVLISITDSNLASLAQSNGNDILFTDSTGTNKLNHEIESYSNGGLVAWVQVPSLSSTADTTLYMYYGNPTASSQQNAAGAWNSNYVGVYHLTATSTAGLADSTSHANSASNSSGGLNTTSGPFGGGAIENPGNYSAYLDIPGQTYNELGGASGTVSMWAYAITAQTYANLAMKGSSADFDLLIPFGGGGGYVEWGGQGNYTSGITLSTGTWYYITLTMNASTNVLTLYINGVAQNAFTLSGYIGKAGDIEMFSGYGENYLTGSEAEFRISNVALSPSWILTEYNNQSARASFYSVGSQQTSGSGSGAVSVTVSSLPTGLTLSVDGNSCSAPCNFEWVANSNHTIAVATTPQSGGTGTQYAYSSWSDSGAQSHTITVPSSAITYTATFATQYYLTTSASPPAGGSIVPASGWYNSSTIVSVHATANAGYTFTGFSGALSGTGTPQQVTMNAPQSVTASFSGLATSVSLYVADSGNNVIRQVLASTGVISTIAGDGNFGGDGNGTAATSAELGSPQDLTVDSAGNIYILDTGNNVVREVSAATGAIFTIAGNGQAGYSGDGGPATNASFDFPLGIALDSSGNIYVADSGNSVVRKISAATGLISTIAGNGTSGYTGDGGSATSAELSEPSSVAVDSAGNLYVADSANNVIRKVTAAGAITTVAGNGTAGYTGDNGAATSAELSYPLGVAVDDSGNVYIADSANNVIREVTASSGNIATIAGNGTAGYAGDTGAATSAELSGPTSVTVDANGNIHIADSVNNVVRKVTVTTGLITTEAGNGTAGYTGDGGAATSATLNYPTGVAFGTTAPPPSQVIPPTISPTAGTYVNSQTVTITTQTSGAAIRYTTDGSTIPSSTVGTPYNGPFAVGTTTTIMAIAYATGLLNSAVVTASYSFQGAPIITGITPTSGAAGTQVTISGSNFGSTQGNGKVLLGTTIASIVTWTSTQIVATVPTGSQTGIAQVIQGGVGSSNTPSFTVNNASLSYVNPTSGLPGATITFTGTGFGATQGNGQVWLGTMAGIVQTWSDTQIVATVAPGSLSGSAQVLQNGVWTNPPAAFAVSVPQITGVSPTSGAPGTSVTITGCGFGATVGSGMVILGNLPAVVQTWSDSQVVASVATGSLTGIAQIQQGGYSSNAKAFAVPPSSGTAITLVPTVLNMVVGDTHQLQALNSSNQSVTGLTWTPSNPNVITLSTATDPPIVTAVGAGTATITAGNASIAVTVSATVLSLGTVLWSNPGDGSGVSQIIPAVPSSNGVADVFALQNDGTVAAITSDGTTAWTVDASQAAALVPDFSGGLVILTRNPSIVDLNGTTGTPNSTFVPSDPSVGLGGIAVHTDGTIFAVQTSYDPQGASVIGINPTTGTQIFGVSLQGSSPPASYFNVLGDMIIAGDGYAYLAYSYVDGSMYPFVAHLMLLRIDSSGSATNFDVLDVPAYTSYQNGALMEFRANLITNADTGVLISWEQAYVPLPDLRQRVEAVPASRNKALRTKIEPPKPLFSTATYGVAIISSTGVNTITSPGVPGQVTNIAPMLQREDGSFIGTVGVSSEDNPQYNMVAFDQTGSLLWMVPNDQPQIATADGGVIGQSGTTYDQNGNASGQIGSLPIYGWRNAYQLGSVDQIFVNPLLYALSFWPFQGGTPSRNSVATSKRDARANSNVDATLSPAFWQKFGKSNCAAVLTQAFPTLIGASFSIANARIKQEATNFYQMDDVGGAVGKLELREVTNHEFANNSVQTLAGRLQQGGAIADTENAGFTKTTVILLPSGYYPQNNPQQAQYPEITLIHELVFHAYTGLPDGSIFGNTTFQNNGLWRPSNSQPSGNTIFLDYWLTSDCHCVPNNPNPNLACPLGTPKW